MSNESDYPAKYQLQDGSGSILLETGTDYLIKETQNYVELVMSDGAICYFRFDEASGNFTDFAGGRTGTAAGSITYSQTGALVGDTDTAILFSNADAQSVIVTGSAALSPAGNSNNLTIEAWITLENNAVGNIATIGKLDDVGGVNGSWLMSFTISSTTVTQARLTGSNTSAGALATVANNVRFAQGASVFHHVVGVFDSVAAECRIYIDGSFVSPAAAWTGTPQVWTSGDLQLGTLGAGGNPLRGRLDELAIYPTALTADQIARHYYCGIQYFDSGIGMSEPAQYPQLLVQ